MVVTTPNGSDTLTGGFIYTAASDTTAPTVTGVTLTGTGAAVNGDIIITFNETMKSGVGSVTLDNSIGTLPSGTWMNPTTYKTSYSGLDWDTAYEITIRVLVKRNFLRIGKRA